MMQLVITALLFAAPAQADSPAHAQRLKVLTYNVFCGDEKSDGMKDGRLREQVERVQKLGADVVCLQEVFEKKVLKAYQTALSKDYDFYFSPEENSVFNWKAAAANLWAGTSNTWGVAFGYMSGRVMAIRKSLGADSSTYSSRNLVSAAENYQFKIVDELKPRGVDFVKLKPEASQLEIGITNVNFTNGEHNATRMNQAHMLKILLDDQVKDLHPSIICGDTNADGEEPEMRFFRETEGWIDTYLQKNPDLKSAPHGGYTWDNANHWTQGLTVEGNQRVDYVYVRLPKSFDLEIHSSKIVLDEKPFTSDHYGVLTDLTLKRR